MTAYTFNAITFANKLKKAGLNEKIAEVHAEEISSLLSNEITTKMDLHVLSRDVQNQFKHVEARFIELENKLTIKLGAMMFVCSGLVITAFKMIVGQ